MSMVDTVAARLAVQVPSRTVYSHIMPNTAPVAARYLWVYSSAPSPQSFDLADSQSLREVTVWVTSGSRNADQEAAAAEAMWGAQAVADALTGWRPAETAWKPVPLSSQPPVRDDDEPDVVVVYVVQQWGFTYQP